jgi:hypothetical protein
MCASISAVIPRMPFKMASAGQTVRRALQGFLYKTSVLRIFSDVNSSIMMTIFYFWLYPLCHMGASMGIKNLFASTLGHLDECFAHVYVSF